MNHALALAQKGYDKGEVPVGALVVDAAGEIIGEGYNHVRAHHDPTAHAEMVALKAACAHHQTDKLFGATLIVTLEPCAMCAQAIAHARIQTLIFGAFDPKSGGVMQGARVFDHPSCHHKPEVYGGIGAGPAQQLLKRFFQARRKKG